MIVNEKVLNKLYNSVDKEILSKAKIYVDSGKVKVYRIKYDDDINFTINVRIMGHGRVYESEISVVNGEVVNLGCECKDYTKVCKHMLAGLIEFATNPKYDRQLLINNKEIQEENRRKFEKQKKYGASYKVIQEFGNLDKFTIANSVKDTVSDGTVRIVPTLKYLKGENKFIIHFYIGLKLLYKLKDLPAFFDCINYGSSYKYGPKFEFKHSIEKFDETSKKIIPFMLKYAEIIKYTNENTRKNTLRNNSFYDTLSKTLNTYEIKLNEEALDELFDVLSGDTVDLEGYDKSSVCSFIDSEPDILFDINKLDDIDYKLVNNFNDSYQVLNGRKYTYFLSGSKLHRCPKDFEDSTLKLLNIFKGVESNEILFSSEDLPAFFSLVVPKVKKNIDSQRLESDELKQYIPKKLGVKLFLDFSSVGDIICNTKFCYGDYEFNPFDINEKIDVVRNINRENNILALFKNTGFEVDLEKGYMFINNDEGIFNFLDNEIDEYMEKFEVLVTDNFKTKEIRQPKVGKVGVKIENNLLQIDFDDLDFNKAELKDVLKMYSIKKKYYRLKDGSFLRLQDNADIDFIYSIASGMNIDYKTLVSGTVRVPIYRSVYLEKLLDNIKNTEVVKNDQYKNFINSIEDNEDNENIIIPKKLDKILRSYQKTGYKWLKVLDHYNFGGILADDMGLGKTIQVITLISSYVTGNKDRKASLVVCPSSLSINWKNEVEKFSDSIKVLIISGKAEERKEQIRKIDNYDLVITSYDLIKRDVDVYNELKYTFKYVIADEAQYIKNSNTKNAIALKSIEAETRFALTGTPIENSLSELWSIFDYIMPGYLFSYNKFKRNYELPIVKDNDEYAANRVKMLIKPFVLRRLKKEVLTELPDKTITILKNEMTEQQNKIYLAYLASAKKELQNEIDTNGFGKNQIKILTLLTRLRQICCHPSLFIDNYKGESSKLNQCMQILKDAIGSGHKVLLFSQFTSMFGLLEKELIKENIEYYKLTGSTDVSERVDMVDEFNNNKDIKVFLISLKAGGTGLNLTGADVVIHYDPWWNLSAENQATDRAYRIGQKNNVQVYKLITQNSIEEKINELQEKKAKLTEDMLTTEETFVNKLSKEDIMSLFE